MIRRFPLPLEPGWCDEAALSLDLFVLGGMYERVSAGSDPAQITEFAGLSWGLDSQLHRRGG